MANDVAGDWQKESKKEKEEPLCRGHSDVWLEREEEAVKGDVWEQQAVFATRKCSLEGKMITEIHVRKG